MVYGRHVRNADGHFCVMKFPLVTDDFLPYAPPEFCHDTDADTTNDCVDNLKNWFQIVHQ